MHLFSRDTAIKGVPAAVGGHASMGGGWGRSGAGEEAPRRGWCRVALVLAVALSGGGHAARVTVTMHSLGKGFCETAVRAGGSLGCGVFPSIATFLLIG